MQCFKGVAVGLPANGTMPAARCEWGKISWVHWSSGDLRVDPQSRALLFTAGGASSGMPAKPLGCLTAAHPVAHEDRPGTGSFLVSTNDSVHGMLRLTFAGRSDDECFLAIAKAAESATASQRRSATTSAGSARRSSFAAWSPQQENNREALSEHLEQLFGGVAPLLVSGCELYGPDPYGDQSEGSEVLMGRGCVAFIDPCEVGRVGSYEMMFFEDDAMEPMLRVPIGPRMKLVEQVNDTTPDRLSIARRQSMANPAIAAAFDLYIADEPARAFAFDREADAAAFRRDFAVRQRLVQLSLRTSRGNQAFEMLQGEFELLKESGLVATLQRLFFKILLVMVVAVSVHAFLIYYYNGASMSSAVSDAIFSAKTRFSSAAGSISEASASVCNAVAQAVPVSAVDRCARLPMELGEGAVRSCLGKLVDMAGGASSA